MAIYIEGARYQRAAEAIAALKPCPYTHEVTVDQIKLALGEHFDIWPTTILDDAFAHSLDVVAGGAAVMTPRHRENHGGKCGEVPRGHP